MYVVVVDLLRWNFPGTRYTTSGETRKVKLTADFRVRSARVWYVITVERHHVSVDICTARVICIIERSNDDISDLLQS